MILDPDGVHRRFALAVPAPTMSDDKPKIVIPILRSGILAREFCRRQANAEIAAVFERSFYLRSGDTFVCVGEPTIGNGPLTLLADFGSSLHLPDFGVYPDRSVSLSDRGITIGDRTQITFERCEPWRRPAWPLPRAPRGLSQTCRVLIGLMTVEAPAEGLGRLLWSHERAADEMALARIARPRIAGFRSWLRDALETGHDPAAGSSKPIAGLIGLGAGLTPSGDDFLVGALALLDALAERTAHGALARAIAAAPRGLTSALSACLLRAAAAGHVGEHLGCAISALVSGAAERAVAASRNIGHSSGWDMMAGAVTALQVYCCRAPRSNLNVSSIEGVVCVE